MGGTENGNGGGLGPEYGNGGVMVLYWWWVGMGVLVLRNGDGTFFYCLELLTKRSKNEGSERTPV